MKTTALSLFVVAGLLSGCSNKPSGEPVAAAQSPAATTGAAAPAQSAPSSGGAQSFTGTVVETMDAASYTYVRVKTPNGDLWAASGQFPVKVGDTVTVPVETPMENFHSPSLKRDFPVIYFASRIMREGDPVTAPASATSGMPALAASHGSQASGGGAMGGMMGGMMGMGGQAPKAAPVVQKMPPPDGGLSVADVWAKRTTLGGKSVTVRGTVVKFNGGIMGRNWFHIQDGSGKADDGSNDLTLTSDAVVKVGDVITATGVVAVDKDFTAGYVYPVIVENAKLVAK